MEAHSAWVACCSAHTAVHSGNEPWLKHFTTKICYLPSSYWTFVGEALFTTLDLNTGGWWNARHPAAYVSTVAETLASKYCFDLPDNISCPLKIDVAIHRNQDLDTLNHILTTEQTCKKLSISPEAARLEAIKVAYELSYAQAGKKLGLTTKQVETYRQEIYRKTHP